MSVADVDTLVDDDRYDLGLLVLARVLIRRWWVIAIVAGLALGVTVRSVGSRVPVYEAGTELRINEAQGEWVFGITGVKAQDPVRVMETQQLTILSRPVWDEVEQRLGTQAMSKIAGLEARILGRADMIQVVVQSTDPAFAQQAANAFAAAYVDVRQLQIRDMLATLGNHLETQAARYREQLVGVNAQIAERTGLSDDLALVGALANETAENVALISRLASANLESDDAELERLLAEREVILRLTVEMRQRAEQVDIDAAVSTAGAQVVSEATSSEGPLGPTATRSLVVALIAGLAAGLAGAFALDYLDDRLRDADVVERELRGVRILGRTPRERPHLRKRSRYATSLARPTGPGADAYRVIRSMLTAESHRHPVQTLLVTSARRHAGKSTVAANLAVALARGGHRVVVVDAHLRHSRLHTQFGVPGAPGLTSVIEGTVALSQSVYHVQGASISGSLRVLSAGPNTSRHANAIADGTRFVDVMRTLQGDADLVILDAPPVLQGSDARVLAGLVDGAVIVVRRKKSRRKSVGAAVDGLRRSGVPVVWGVLNGFGRSWRRSPQARAQLDDLRVETQGVNAPTRSEANA